MAITNIERVQAERAAIAKREEVERKQADAAERKQREDAETKRLKTLIMQYEFAQHNSKNKEAEPAAIDAKIADFGADMPTLWQRWTGFVGSPAHKHWMLERQVVAGMLPPGFSEDDFRRLKAYEPIRQQRAGVQAALISFQQSVSQLEAQEPALLTIKAV